MGLFDIFKKKKSQEIKPNVDNEYRNDYEIKVELLVSYPEIFDPDKIANNLNDFFNDFFSNNPANEYDYNGMNMLFAKALFNDSCVVKIIFDEDKIEYLDDDQIRVLKRKLCKMTSVPEDFISIKFMTFVEKLDEMDKKRKSIQNLEKLNAELKESNAKLEELMKDFEKSRNKW
ncbi:MAG TPA: hypothetical protein GXZ35_08265 [Acholeplasmataceae bacterium]|jgi:hypothetical protein|nr:hypothetical protein [Acholeplasmataceae bacterium]